MANEKLFNNTYGAIVTISGCIHTLIRTMNRPATFDAIEKGNVEGTEAKISTTFKKGNIKFQADADTAFVISFMDKIFIQDRSVEIIRNDVTDTWSITGCILAFQGIDGFEAARKTAASLRLTITDDLGSVCHYNGFDDMREGYKLAKEKK